MNPLRILSLKISGYRPFKDFLAHFGTLEVIAGSNGSGKTSIFEFLKFLRDSIHQDIPPEIVAGSIGQQIFHLSGPERFWWSVEIDINQPIPIRYQGEVMGPVGRTHVSFERVQSSRPLSSSHKKPFILMNIRERRGVIKDPYTRKYQPQDIVLKRPNQLALGAINNPMMDILYNLREYIRDWKFYSAFNIAHHKIRKSVPLEQEPVLHEDAGNLSSLLHYLMTEHQPLFDELQQHLRSLVPGFIRLNVKARGGPGEVIAFWQEEGFDRELSLADLSDGILRLICWTVLCVQPNPPPLICIDEPDQGVHPRTLPVLAGLFEKASERTQILLATHASYFLAQFELNRIAVMRKEDGAALFIKPGSSAILRAALEDFGAEEIELLHRSDELERIP